MPAIQNFFIPNQNNQYYPIALRKKMLFTYVVFMFIFNIFASTFLAKLPGQTYADNSYSGTDIISLTNQDRLANNLTSLNENAQLDNAAKAKADDMFKYQYWAHYNPTTGATPWSFIAASGYTYSYAGENLAEGFNSAQDVNDAWMNSPEHKANILNTDYEDIGVATESGNLLGSNVILVVQLFGKPSTAIPVVIPVTTPQPTKQAVQTPSPSPTLHPTIKPTQSPNKKLTGIITQTPIPTATPPIQTITQTVSPTNVPQTPTASPFALAKHLIKEQVLQSIRTQQTSPYQNNIIESFAVHIQNMKFVNKVDFFISLFLFLVFSLDSFYYYKVRAIHPRHTSHSISHLPILGILIVLCLIGNPGIII